ncbi:replication initiation protein [Flavobacterium phage vB_FspP_elemoE_6-9C]|uniref:Replication protein n=2 Tax=Elemovirus TaxID=2948694 RepID=A0A7D7IMU6_9CAUD|nr:replication initiation protein [Flavobacterium phage vB_FspP_elemoF_6-3D]YP_010109011.1 replication initiation protein [Flavobacterium phage vB_FspP_elemoE_6-9C]QMP85179.1 replication protein [Flavobacterium phage vB_FspP_elemoF_6-3D]QMP85267.1 replication protein [Flavobacterium phage vB_FspP_elemoE_6-9C]QMP85803.1 replication protein [Flavobacterium phage vB_FspP_elemoE_10-3D]
MNHSFNVDIAKKYGVELAIILENMQWWIAKNKANKKHFHQGSYWTYNSVKAFSELFPYWSVHQIGRFLRRLEDEGLIVSKNFNKAGYDKTKWYTVNDSLILQNCNIECAEMHNPLCENAQPIPDINTDINNSLVGSSQTPTKKDSKKDLFKTKLSEVDVELLDKKQKEYYSVAINFQKLFIHNKKELGLNNFKDQENATYLNYVEPIRLAIEVDGWSVEDFRNAYAFLIKDEFWKKNILSTSKLRDKMEQLVVKSKDINKKQILPSDFWVRELSDEQKKLLSDKDLTTWERQKTARLMEGGRMLPIKIEYEK